jgi:hypothetical protein
VPWYIIITTREKEKKNEAREREMTINKKKV